MQLLTHSGLSQNQRLRTLVIWSEAIINPLCFPSGSEVKNPLTMQETWFWSPSRAVPLEEETTVDWRIPWAEEPGGLQCVGSQRVRHD